MDVSFDLAQRLELLKSQLDFSLDISNRALPDLEDQEEIFKNARAKLEPVSITRKPSSGPRPSVLPEKFKPSVSEPNAEKAKELATMEFNQYSKLAKQELAPPQWHFAPWKLVFRYPDMYIGKTNRPKAKPFFEDERIKNMLWDFFYIYHPKNSTEPILFVPTEQVERLLNLINSTVGIALTIPGGIDSSRFYVAFGAGGQPRPRYLGRSSTTAEFAALANAIPLISSADRDMLAKATQYGIDDLVQKLSSKAWGDDGNHKKKNATKQRQRAERKTRAVDDTLRYLGLEVATSGPGGVRMDTSKPAPRLPERSVVFVCIDIELMEQCNTVVTEVGISILDTKDTIGVPSGQRGENWFPLIQSRHLRVDEYRFHMNRKYVQGCPDSFDFGTSEFPTQGEVARVVEDIFFQYSDRVPGGQTVAGKQKRDVVIVGHSIEGDMHSLAQMGVDIGAAGNFYQTIDTQDLHQGWRGLQDGRGLSYVLSDLGIRYKYLHNAGNDAAYTLRALLAMAVTMASSEKPEPPVRQERDIAW